MDVVARLSPESAGRMGVDGLDEAITDYSDGYEDRAIAANREAESALRAALPVGRRSSGPAGPRRS